MNQNNNRESEITDSNSLPYQPHTSKNNANYSRYPFANEPNQPLQPTNYKEWLINCQQDYLKGNTSESFDDNTIAAVSAGIAVAGTMLALVGPLLIPGAVLASFATLLPLLYPGKEKQVWQQFMTHGENLLNQTIAQTVRETALANLEGFRNVLESYQSGLRSWELLKEKQVPGLPPSAALQQAAHTVKIRFEIAHSDFIRDMSYFQMSTYKTMLLSTYAQAANLHLCLLNQGVKFADQWNADAHPSQNIFEENSGTSEGYYQLLIKYTAEYSNYCVKTYKAGLNTLKNSPDMKWHIYNTYRRDMTVIVLDLIATFPMYDSRKYPIGTITELTREVYTPALESQAKTSFPIEEADQELTRPPHLFTWLNRLDFFTDSDVPAPRLDGVQNFYSYTNDSNISASPIYQPPGANPIPGTLQNQMNFEGRGSVYKVLLTHSTSSLVRDSINRIDFFLNEGSQEPLTYRSTGVQQNTFQQIFEFPDIKGNIPQNRNDISHMLSYMKISTSERKRPKEPLAFAWTHSSVDRNNTIFPDKITRIPAVKARLLNPDSKVIFGPGYTGGDLVLLQNGSQRGQMELQCHTGSSQKKYALRIHYAGHSEGNDFRIAVIIPQINSKIVNLTSTFSGSFDNLLYEDFVYTDIFDSRTPFQLPAHRFITIRIQYVNNFAGRTLLINKIEFIPVDELLTT
ncbi:insecticidal delta-endotoxin Cry8Ea1 family protein [Bacillus cereus]|uniref:insecticidal delta-endotoxin Cry8Ea1 family protein n=1 Tax=Bacillus cereus TaxID=1396 RepID=UPI003D16FC22